LAEKKESIGALPSVEELASLLSYNAETGVLRWKVSRGRFAKPGVIAGTPHHGYVRVTVNRRFLYAHRIAWAMSTGKWPTGDIDHINGNRSDNRLKNLRDVSHAANTQNRRGPQTNNTSGYLGVSRHTTNNKWVAELWAYRKKHYIGSYDRLQDAVEARKAAEHKYFKEISA